MGESASLRRPHHQDPGLWRPGQCAARQGWPCCNISQIAHERVEKETDYRQEGQIVKVKALEADDKGRIKLSMKALIERPAGCPSEPRTGEFSCARRASHVKIREPREPRAPSVRARITRRR